jgi:hypothetical protein
MTIEEGNKLIAEFMGKTFRAYKGNSSVMEDFKTYADCLKAIKTNKWKGYAPEIGWRLGCGKYHESWDWLMPVVDKIRSYNNVIAFEICFCLGVIVKVRYGDEWHNYESNNALEVIWTAVVEFIQWYNLNKI